MCVNQAFKMAKFLPTNDGNARIWTHVHIFKCFSWLSDQNHEHLLCAWPKDRWWLSLFKMTLRLCQNLNSFILLSHSDFYSLHSCLVLAKIHTVIFERIAFLFIFISCLFEFEFYPHPTPVLFASFSFCCCLWKSSLCLFAVHSWSWVVFFYGLRCLHLNCICLLIYIYLILIRVTDSQPSTYQKYHILLQFPPVFLLHHSCSLSSIGPPVRLLLLLPQPVLLYIP